MQAKYRQLTDAQKTVLALLYKHRYEGMTWGELRTHIDAEKANSVYHLLNNKLVKYTSHPNTTWGVTQRGINLIEEMGVHVEGMLLLEIE